MQSTLQLFAGGSLVTALATYSLLEASNAAIPEFLDRNPTCLAEDLESTASILRSFFKKTEAFRLVLIAMAGSFFVHRLCCELGRIIMDAQDSAREKEEESKKKQRAENVITQLVEGEEGAAEKKRKQAEKSLRRRKSEEAIDLIATCLDAFAFYYYVQRRALLFSEVNMFDTNFCIKIEHDWQVHSLQWLYVRLGVSVHDCYKHLKQYLAHQNRIHVDPESPTNRPASIAYAGSFLSSALLVAFLMVCLQTIDSLMLSHIVTWVYQLDQLRLALGLTCMTRIFIVHAETRTLLLCTGFFTYLFVYGLYKSWANSEEQMEKAFADPSLSLFEHTKELFLAQKTTFFLVAIVQIATYYVHVYKQATWKSIVNPDPAPQEDVKVEKEEKDNKKEELKQQVKKGKGSKKGGSKATK